MKMLMLSVCIVLIVVALIAPLLVLMYYITVTGGEDISNQRILASTILFICGVMFTASLNSSEWD